MREGGREGGREGRDGGREGMDGGRESGRLINSLQPAGCYSRTTIRAR